MTATDGIRKPTGRWLAAVAAALLVLAGCEGGGPFGDREAEAALAEVAAAMGGGEAAETTAEDEAAAPESEAALDAEAEQAARTDTEGPAETAEAEPAAAPEPPKRDPNAAARAACKRSGGLFTTTAQGKVGYCTKYTRDANRSCETSAACEGYCLARSRSCAPVTPLLGCHLVLTDRGVASEICVN